MNNEFFILEGSSLIPKIFKIATILFAFACLIFCIINTSEHFFNTYTFCYSSISNNDNTNEVTTTYNDNKYKIPNDHHRILQALVDKNKVVLNSTENIEKKKEKGNEKSKMKKRSNSISTNITTIENTNIFYLALSQSTYKGTWSLTTKQSMKDSSIFNSFRNNNGTFMMMFERKLYAEKSEVNAYTANMRFCDGKTIDQWIHFLILGIFNEKTKMNDKKSILKENSLKTYITKGELFDRIQDDISKEKL